MQIRHNRCVEKLKLQEYFHYLPRFEKLPFTGKSNFSVEDDKVDPTTVEFNKKITTEVQNSQVKIELLSVRKQTRDPSLLSWIVVLIYKRDIDH